MATYLMPVEVEYDLCTAKELAERLAHDYGIVSFRGKAHEDLARAFLDADLQSNGKTRMIKDGTPRVYVYQNEDALLDFADELLPLLEDHKAVSVGIRNCTNGTIKYWRVYWNETLVLHRGKPYNIDFALKKFRYHNGVFYEEEETRATEKAA